MWDYRIGQIKTPDIPVAIAVAASSAFPPFLSPVIFNTKKYQFTENTGTDLNSSIFKNKIYLTDGGIYDNLALESAKGFETILVSDGSRYFSPLEKNCFIYFNQLLRAKDILLSQIRKLRLRRLINDFEQLQLKGTYWGISTNINDYGTKVFPPEYVDLTKKLSKLSTRLYKMSEKVAKDLLNFGYIICEQSINKYLS